MKINKLILLSIMFSVLMVLPSAFALDESLNETEVKINSGTNPLKGSSNYYFNSSESNDGEGTKSNPHNRLTYDRFKSNSNLYFANGEYTFDHGGYKPLYNVNIYGEDPSKTVIDGGNCEIINYNGDLYFENVTLKNFLFVNINGNLEAKNSIFTSSNRLNLVSDYDGGIIHSTYSNIKLTDCILKDSAAIKGGAVYVENGLLEIINSDFINNTASYYGGAIAVHYSTTVSISNSRFVNGKSSQNAGAGIYLYESGLTLSNSNFTNMQAKIGSAITSLSSNMVINGIRCENNVADYEGGAIYSMYETVTLTNSYFVNNTARSGGALFIDRLGQSSIRANSFMSNEAQEYGGAICSLFNEIELSNNNYQNNLAKNGNDQYESSSVNLIFSDNNYTPYSTTDETIIIIPASYSLVDEGFVTPVKSQGPNGNCWAFSALAALESCILKAGGTVVDLSENNLKNLITYYSDYGLNKPVNDGGNFKTALAYLSSWLGPISEQDDLYDANSVISTFIGSTMHVQNALFFKRTSYLDNDEIKKAILKYGAVATSMYYGDEYVIDNVHYCYDPIASDHAVTVVGWDDTINVTGKLGAWLVKNSWGPEWGDNGYFYVSYYDETLLEVGKEDGYTFVLNDTIPLEKIYQHETTGVNSWGTGHKYKNVFYSTDDEYLAAVSTYFNTAADWTVEILVNGKLNHSQSGHISQAGYFTLNLNTLVKLNKGDKFEVVVGLTGENGEKSFAVARSSKAIRDGNFKSGVSYVINTYGVERDLFGDGVIACIKAFTLSASTSTNNLTIIPRGNVVDIISTIMDKNGNPINKGYVTFSINGVETTVMVSNGVASLSNVLLAEENHISSTFNAEGYSSSSNSTSFTRTGIAASDMTATYGNNDVYSISLSDIFDAGVSNRKVVFEINSQSTTAFTDANGVARLPINFEAGSYNVKISYAGFTSNDASYSIVKTIKVNKKDIDVQITSNVDKDTATITIKAGNFNGNVEITVDGVGKNYQFVNGQLSIYLNNLNYGTHSVGVASPSNYNFLNNQHNFNIAVKRTTLRSSDMVVYYNQNGYYSVQLVDVAGNPVSGKEIIFSTNGNTYKNITDSNGFASLHKNLEVGMHDIAVEFKGDAQYIGSLNSSKVLVKTTIELGSSQYVSNSYYNAIFLNGNGNPMANSKVKVTLNNQEHEVYTNELGRISLKLDKLSGQYSVGLLNPITGEYKTQVIDVSIGAVDLSKTTLTINVNGNEFSIQANVVDSENKPVDDGQVKFNVNGIEYTRNVTEGKATIATQLNSETIQITAVFNSKFYNTSSDSVQINRTEIIANDLTCSYGDANTFQVRLADKYSGSVSNCKVVFEINGQSTTAFTDANGIARLPIDLAAGTYYIKISYAGYASSDASYGIEKTVKVNKKQIGIEISSNVSGNNAIIQVIAGDIDDDVIVTVDGKSTAKKIENGLLRFELNNLTHGIHNIRIESSLNYIFSDNTHAFNVGAVIGTKINAYDIVEYSNKNILYSIQLVDDDGNPLSQQDVVFTFNEKDYYRNTDAMGYASISFKLNHGIYRLDISFNGDDTYKASNKTVMMVIKPTILVENKVYDSQFSIVLIDSEGNPAANQRVNINIGGKDHIVTTNDNGVASIALNLANGDYDVVITNLATNEVITKSISVAKKVTVYNWIVENKDLKMYYGSGKAFTVRVCDDNGKYVAGLKVTFKVNGVTVKAVSNSKGYASVKINLKPGKYKITASYHGKTVKNNIVVKPTLTAKNVKVKKGKTVKFSAKLINSKGKALKNKKVIFKIKGKTYKIKTNKKGYATLKLKLKLKIGKYTIKTSYGKNSIKNTIRIIR